MAPEYSDFLQCGSQCPDPTCAVDLWSLGCVIYELFVKSCPFKVEDSIFRRYCVDRVLPGEFEATFASEEARNVVQVLLDPRPEYRITADDLLSTSWLVEESAQTPRLNPETPQISVASLSLDGLSSPPSRSMYSCDSSQAASSISLASSATLFDPPEISRVSTPHSSISSFSELNIRDGKRDSDPCSPLLQPMATAFGPHPIVTQQQQWHRNLSVPDTGREFQSPKLPRTPYDDKSTELPVLQRYSSAPMPNVRRESNPPLPPRLPRSSSTNSYDHSQPKKFQNYPILESDDEAVPSLPQRPSPSISSTNNSQPPQRHQSYPSPDIEKEQAPALPTRSFSAQPSSHLLADRSRISSITSSNTATNTWTDTSVNQAGTFYSEPSRQFSANQPTPLSELALNHHSQMYQPTSQGPPLHQRPPMYQDPFTNQSPAIHQPSIFHQRPPMRGSLPASQNLLAYQPPPTNQVSTPIPSTPTADNMAKPFSTLR